MSELNQKDDWRRQGQERYLAGQVLTAKEYRPYRADWDHDHCEFCGAKFSLNGRDLTFGYCTLDGYHWICPDCFEEFKEEFRWTLAEPGVPTSQRG